MQVPAAKIVFPEDTRKRVLEQIDGVLQTGQLTLGKYGREFEEKFAEYVGTSYAIAVNSGTSSLEIILRALDIEGSSVIVPTNTFIASPASVLHAGGKVVFADSAANLCLDPDAVRNSIRDDTRAVMIVHIGGMIPPEVREIQQICAEKGLYLIEDAAHAHGSTLDGEMAGSLSRAASFSFYPTKVMTSAEGGMITTDDEKLCQRAQVFRDQGKAGFFGNVHTELGYNWRMSEIHAVIGIAQFGLLEQFVAERRRIASIYDSELQNLSRVKPVPIPESSKSNYYKYIAILDEGIDRAAVKQEMKEKYEVGLSGEVYELPCHLQPIFKEMFGFKGGEFPVAEDLCRRQICLPLFPTMTDEQARHVVSSLKEVVG